MIDFAQQNSSPSLDGLARRYAGAPVAPAPVDPVAAARERYDAASQRLRAAAMAGMQETPKGPSESEKYFRLASAFLDPGKTGSFGEAAGRAAAAMGDYNREKRAAEKDSLAERRNFASQLAELDMDAAGTNLNTELTMQARRDAVEEKRNAVTGAAANQAQAEGLIPGTPAFIARVKEIYEQDMAYKQATQDRLVGSADANTARIDQMMERERLKDETEREARNKKIDAEAVELQRALVVAQRMANNTDGMAGATGLDASLPSLRAATREFEADLKELTSLLTMANLGRLTGVLSNSDILLIGNAASGIDPKAGEPRMIASLSEIEGRLVRAIADAEQKKSASSGGMSAEKEAGLLWLEQHPNDPQYAEIKERLNGL